MFDRVDADVINYATKMKAKFSNCEQIKSTERASNQENQNRIEAYPLPLTVSGFQPKNVVICRKLYWSQTINMYLQMAHSARKTYRRDANVLLRNIWRNIPCTLFFFLKNCWCQHFLLRLKAYYLGKNACPPPFFFAFPITPAKNCSFHMVLMPLYLIGTVPSQSISRLNIHFVSH